MLCLQLVGGELEMEHPVYEAQELCKIWIKFFFRKLHHHLSTYQFERNYRHYLVIFNHQFHHESNVIDPYIRQFFGSQPVIIVAFFVPEATGEAKRAKNWTIFFFCLFDRVFNSIPEEH